MNDEAQKEVQARITKNLLDVIVLRLINQQSMHGYQIIAKIRTVFGIYFSSSTVYPLLSSLEKNGCVNGEWSMTAEKPRKVFTITSIGKERIKSTENMLNLIYKTLKTFEKPIGKTIKI
jgi:DNA-binding PadR family transcriptional regulator